MEKVIYLLQIITEISPEAEVRLKMQAEGLDFLKMQKSLRAKSMKKKKKNLRSK